MKFAALTILLSATSVHAHPHVFVDTNVEFVVNSSQLTALRINWRYDEFTSLVLFDTLDLDPDGDGQFDDEDRQKVVRGETHWDDGYDGDIHLSSGDMPVAMGKPHSGEAEFREGRVALTFELPLAQPIEAATATLKLFDPFYYYAYRVLEGSVDGDGCQLTLIPFAADAASAKLQDELAKLSREEFPDDENVGERFADTLRLSCASS